MNENEIITEETIGDIILCEPITRKGKEALNRLGLTIDDINPSFFYENLRVVSKYDVAKDYEEKKSNYEHTHLFYQYTVDRIQFNDIKERFKKFNSRFSSNSPNEYPLLMLGVAGNGKSIEINRLIRSVTSGDNEFECDRAYFDLEDAFTKITYGDVYKCPKNSALWLFCIKLLDGIMQYIKQCHLLCGTILENFNKIIVQNNLATEKQRKLFENIGAYIRGNNNKETAVFCSLKALLSSQDADSDIQMLLETLMWIMFCSNPQNKQYIVIDNIEQYIKLNQSKIQIPNSDISTLYKSINSVVMNMINAFGRIEKDLGWKAFKIVLVLRRTSVGLLDSTFLHSPVRTEQNIADLTGYFQIPDIWWQKKKYIWDERLSEKFGNSTNKAIIEIVDQVMNDGINAIGTDYQAIIAPLMSYGIRRNARAQAHAAYSAYELMSKGNSKIISIDEFKALMSAIDRDNTTIRYMFRRALIEFQFKWSISNGAEGRWEKLGIGHLAKSNGEKYYTYEGRRFTIENVAYFDNKHVSLARRILTYLSYYPDRDIKSVGGKCKSVVDMFLTISLFDLINGVLVNPKGNKNIPKEDFIAFSRVLIALSDMSNGDTKSAPYVILGINDSNFHSNTNEQVLAELLNTIWESGKENSLPGKKYNCSDFGARITDAGYSFLLDWHPSFSFMASLHCFTIPPLFFLKDVSSIKYVIEKVYTSSLKLCEMYEDEAKVFCGQNITLKTGKYLLMHDDKYITFKQRVKDLHLNHLNHYREFLEKNYKILSISKDDMLKLTSRYSGYITMYIEKYSSWETEKGAPECF